MVARAPASTEAPPQVMHMHIERIGADFLVEAVEARQQRLAVTGSPARRSSASSNAASRGRSSTGRPLTIV